jgi:predicted Fe-S protein YdhL (DUF1289 family)
MTASPCIGVCRLDARTQVCVGCGRTIAEIAAWPSLSAEERRAIVARLQASDGSTPNAPAVS